MTRFTIIEHAGWRRPILADHEECYDETVEASGRRGVRHILHDRFQVDDLGRLGKGEACENCLEVFPARPAPENVSRFREVYADRPGPIQLPWRERVMNGCCPVCGSEVSPEFYAALHKGVLPDIPEISEAE